jgi:hypothetical protein
MLIAVSRLCERRFKLTTAQFPLKSQMPRHHHATFGLLPDGELYDLGFERLFLLVRHLIGLLQIMKHVGDIMDVPLDIIGCDGYQYLFGKRVMAKSLHNGSNGHSKKNGKSKLVKEVLHGSTAGHDLDLEALKLSDQVFNVWKLRLGGHSVMDISQQLSIPPQEVIAMIDACHAAQRVDSSRMAEIGIQLDLDRIDLMLKSWLPIATTPEIVIEKIQRGDTVEEIDIDRPLKALFAVCDLLKTRAKIQNYGSVKEETAGKELLQQLLRYLDSTALKSRIRELTES